MLRILELEYNNLTGSIPELNNLSRLRKFNVSYNRLNGLIPSGLSKFSNVSFLGNTLCGSPLTACPSDNDGNGGGKKLSTGAIIGIVVGSVIGLILILLVLFLLLRKRSPQTTPPQVETSLPPPPGKPPVSDIELGSPKPLIVREASGDGGSRNGDTVVVNGVQSGRGDGLVFFGEGSVAFALEDLLRAPAEVLGKGTSGSTYKAYLEGETQVVKRLRDVCVSEREFREKVENLGMLAHENLVPFRAYYCGREEKLIVFDCMPMGSLSALLHGEFYHYYFFIFALTKLRLPLIFIILPISLSVLGIEGLDFKRTLSKHFWTVKLRRRLWISAFGILCSALPCNAIIVSFVFQVQS